MLLFDGGWINHGGHGASQASHSGAKGVSAAANQGGPGQYHPGDKLTKILTLDGRKFTGVNEALAANQDDYVFAHLRLAHAMEALNGEAWLTRILLSGRTHHILAGFLTEEGRVWNRKDA